VANGGYAGVSLDARYKFPFVEPEIAVAAGIPNLAVRRCVILDD
jgi:hypothetical protein